MPTEQLRGRIYQDAGNVLPVKLGELKGNLSGVIELVNTGAADYVEVYQDFEGETPLLADTPMRLFRFKIESERAATLERLAAFANGQ